MTKALGMMRKRSVKEGSGVEMKGWMKATRVKQRTSCHPQRGIKGDTLRSGAKNCKIGRAHV